MDICKSPYIRTYSQVIVKYVEPWFIRKIKSIDGGHESKVDAIACMDLMKWKIKSDLQKTTRRGSVT